MSDNNDILTLEEYKKLNNLIDIEDISKTELIKNIHDTAYNNKYNKYVDPDTGYSVFTSYFLEKRRCCGNKCRHCPYNHINVKKKL